MAFLITDIQRILGKDQYINTIGRLGKLAADTAIGQGIIFNAQDQKIQDFWDKFNKKQNLSIKLWKWAYQNSIVGRAHLWLVNTDSGELQLQLGELFSNVRVSIWNEEEIAASIYTMKNQDNLGHYYIYEFTKNKLVIKHMMDENKTAVNTVFSEVPEGLRTVNTWEFKNDIDLVPIIETTNLPKPNLFPTNTINLHPDWAPAFKLIKDLQEIIKQKRKERKKNQTWFNGAFGPEMMEKIHSMGGDTIAALKDGLISANGSIEYTKGGTNGFEIVLGDPPLEKYNQDWLHTEIQIFNECGYNHPREAEAKEGYTSQVQTLVNNVLTEQTTRVKQEYYKTKLLKLFDYVLIHNGLWDGKGIRPYDFDFQSIGMTDIFQKDQIINSRLQNGTMSQVGALQEYDNLDYLTAKKELEQINKDREEFEMEFIEVNENQETPNENKIEGGEE